MKCDPRVRYTQMIIKKAFLELLQQKPMSKITVREICDRAEINRSTFYKHYLDCYDLLDKLKEEALAQLDELILDMEENGEMSVLLAVLQTLKDNADTFKLAASDAGREEFIRQAVLRGYRYLNLYISISPERQWDDGKKTICYAFLTGGIGSVIEHWMLCGCVDPPEQIASVILELGGILTAGLAEK